MPSRAYTSFLQGIGFAKEVPMVILGVNALSGLYLISTVAWQKESMPTESVCVNALSGLYLISTHWPKVRWKRLLSGVNALSGLYLISTT